MSKKPQRADDQTTVTFSLSKDLNEDIRDRCKELQISKSSYFRLLVIQDITTTQTLKPREDTKIGNT